MRRVPACLLVFFAFLANAGADAFPLPHGAERPVSDVVLGAAPGSQWDAHVATNGDIGLVAWRDARARPSATVVYASRIDGEGRSLDPLGVRLADVSNESVNAVLWDGHTFVVVIGRTLVSVTTDGTIAATKQLDLPLSYGYLAATSGSSPRLLFAEQSSANGAIVDTDGHVLVRKALGTIPADTLNAGLIGAGNDSGFLVLRGVRNQSLGTQTLRAERLDAAGNSISSTDSGLPFPQIRGTEALAGGGDGFLLVQQAGVYSSIVAYFLDDGGAYHGQKKTLISNDVGSLRTLATWTPSLVREGGRYVAVWQTTGLDLPYEMWVADIRPDGSATVNRSGQWTGTTGAIAYASSGSRRFLAWGRSPKADSDVFAATVSPALVPCEAHLIGLSGPLQSNAQIAAGANGFAVAWGELEPDNIVQVSVRRFSAEGVPQDAAPLGVMAFPGVASTVAGARMRIVSNGETYLIGCQSGPDYLIRRLAARTGEWLDAQPVKLPGHDRPEIASNGIDALAFSVESCAAAAEFATCVTATPIPMSSRPPGPRVVSEPTTYDVGDIALSANGADYLATWSYSFTCFFPCSSGPSQLHAARLRGDGTALDASLLELDNGYRYPFSLSSTSNDGRYLVVWQDSGGVRATRVTREGAVLDRDAQDGAVLIASNGNAPHVAALGRRFVLLYLDPHTSNWNGVVFAPDADFDAVQSMAPTTLLPRAYAESAATVAAASNDGVLALVYDHLGDAATGGVPRVFLRLYKDPARRRVAGR